MPARLIRTGLGDPARVSAIDEAVLDSVVDGDEATTLHVYRRDRPTVSLGRFSDVDEEVDRDYCEAEDVAIVRRLSAGGAIYTDPGHVLFGLAAPELGGSPDAILEQAATALAASIEDGFGAEAEFVPDNDVHVGGLKVCGMAVAIRRTVPLLHGSLIVQLDVEGMAGALGRTSEEVSRGVASLGEAVGRDVAVEEAEETVADAFGDLLDDELVPRELSETEEARVRHLIDARYNDEEWTYRR